MENNPGTIINERFKEVSENVVDELERNFPDISLESVKYLGSGLDNNAYLVNGNEVFRFARSLKTKEGAERELLILDFLKGEMNGLVPEVLHRGFQKNGARVAGQTYFDGEGLTRETLTESVIIQMAEFLNRLHSMNVEPLREVGVEYHDHRKYSRYRLEKARKELFPVLEKHIPEDADILKKYIEDLFEGYISDDELFSYVPALIHSDFVGEHIKLDSLHDEMMGVIDWGGSRIGDPDFDVWRAYSQYGEVFMKTFLPHYQYRDRGQLSKKIDFFFRSQIISRALRAIRDTPEDIPRRLTKIKNHALGRGYFEYEI